MIYGLVGKLKSAGLNFITVDVGGVVYKVFIPLNQGKPPKEGEKVEIFTHLHVREDGMALYGFWNERELNLFESLVSVSGIGPKSAMAILSMAAPDKILAAISRGEPEILQRSSGIGKKTAERIILELRDKIAPLGEKAGDLIASDQDVYEALVSLGYARKKIDEVLREIDPSLTDVRSRLREALRKIRD